MALAEHERLRRKAQEIIVTQRQEIAAMRMVSGKRPPRVVPAPDWLNGG
jgi:uncharacterized protein (DUF305 family)